MSDTIQLEIITSTEPAISAGIKQLYIPAYLGKAGVLEDHKPYVSLLKPGEIFYTDVKNRNFYLYIHDGFIEVNDNKVCIISDVVEKGEKLLENKEEIEKKLEEVNAKIKSSLKLEDGMTPEQIIDMPDQLRRALDEQTELETKREIIRKLEQQK